MCEEARGRSKKVNGVEEAPRRRGGQGPRNASKVWRCYESPDSRRSSRPDQQSCSIFAGWAEHGPTGVCEETAGGGKKINGGEEAPRRRGSQRPQKKLGRRSTPLSSRLLRFALQSMRRSPAGRSHARVQNSRPGHADSAGWVLTKSSQKNCCRASIAGRIIVAES